jgi:hypothetical protein
MAKPKRRPTKAERHSGPYLTAAFFCEKVIEEKDGVPSYLRVVDILTVPEPPPEFIGEKDGVPILPATLINVVIMLKSGEAKGKRTVRIIAIAPSGERTKGLQAEVTLAGGETGAILRGPVPIPITQEGLFWFEVRVDGKFFTRVPLRIVYSKPTPESPPQPTTGPRGKG